MDYSKATSEQLSDIVANDIDCPTHLLSGVVTELLNRNKFEGLITKTIIKRFKHTRIAIDVLGMPEEDIRQLCRMSLFTSIEKFTPGKSSFLFFAHMRMYSDLKDKENRVKAGKRKVYENIQSIDCQRNEKGESFVEIFPSTTNVEREVIRKLSLEESMQPLTRLERKTLLLYLKGYSSTEIGQMMDKSRKAVARQINNGLSKMCGYKTSIKELGMLNTGKAETA
ncbi:sigma-70 family RNA polymerase sigma factor [Cytobacillus sp. FSL W8-0315]|uniref:sigma-70 family RNA polymerase sigma factor n=1 Tax=Cytobacillus sp. FSL W8-0315 TaxID=2921600 RepID=UPI0030FB8FF5